MTLPARVRISELKKLPEPALLERLKRIEPEKAALLERGVLAGQRLAVAIAGGAAVGWALCHPQSDSPNSLELALMAVWRGRGIEEALYELFGVEIMLLEGTPHEA
jgi:hypothetical protein